MSGISTKEIKKTLISKEIKPGNVEAKINLLKIEKNIVFKNNVEVEEYVIKMELETHPIGGDFVGFDKVYNSPEMGQFLGQTKLVKYSNWPISDASGVSKKTNKPFNISASSKILEFLQKVLTICNHPDWLQENDGKFPNWQSMFDAINRGGLLKDVYMSWCLAGTESINAKGYSAYYLYLPDRKDANYPFNEVGGLVTTFNPAIHIKPDVKKLQINENLENGIDDVTTNLSNDFDIDTAPLDDDLFEIID